MKNKIALLGLCFTLFLMIHFGCNQVVSDEKPGSHARISEVLVVMDKDLWKGETGDSVRAVLGEFYPYLNQPEPYFSIIFRTPDQFDNTYSIFRNILYFVREPDLSGGTIQKETDYWAKPQTVIQIKGPDKASLLGLFMKNKSGIMKAFNDSEIRRLKKVMNSISKGSNADAVQQHLGVGIAVPEGFYIAKKDTGFIWVRKVIRRQTQESAFWITEIPYTDTSQFQPSRVIALRDSVAKKYIPIMDEESYMSTEYRFGYQHTTFRLNGAYAMEIRGFWKTIGNFSMGGPFLNYLIHDEKNGRLIMIDCYVFKPNENKRDLIRQLEGIVHTLDL